MIFHFVKIIDDLELFKGKTPKIRVGEDFFGQYVTISRSHHIPGSYKP